MIKWIVLVLAAAYFLWPIDAVPDMAIGVGWLDDLILAFLAWRFFRAAAQRLKAPGAGHDSRSGPGLHKAPEPDPYTVLGVPPSATTQEVRAAYRSLVQKYHPDKVAHLGDEFRDLAETRFKEIQKAYDTVARP